MQSLCAIGSHRFGFVLAVSCGVLLGPSQGAIAAVLLADSADDPAYSDGWQDGDNGGFGLGPWIGAGTLGSASGNGADILPTIDTSGVSWSLAAGSSGIRRPLDAVVGVGVTLSMRLDVGANDFFGPTCLSSFNHT